MRRLATLTILGFNAVTAILGGIGLITGSLVPPLSLLRRTPFTSYLLPGVILAGLVGGSALWGFMALMNHHRQAPMLAFFSGITLCGWIVGEIALTQIIQWLQFLYLALGSALMALTYSDAKTTVLKGGTL